MSWVNLWVHTHPWMVIATVFCVGGSLGMLVAALLGSVGNPANVREQERQRGHW